MATNKSRFSILAFMAVAFAICVGCASEIRSEEEARIEESSRTADIASVPVAVATPPDDEIDEDVPTAPLGGEPRSSSAPFVEMERPGLDPSVVIHGETFLQEVAPTIEEDIINRSYNQSLESYYRVPHFVVRGRFVAGTSRCRTEYYFPSKVAGLSIPKFRNGGTSRHKSMLVCVSDFVVDEYMVSTGSDNLTFFTYDALGWFDIPDFDSSDTSSDYSYEIFASGIERKVAEPLEGREWVVWGAPPENLAVKAWDMVHRWHVDRTSAEVRVRDYGIDMFVDSLENLDNLDHTFEDYRSAVTEAFEVLSATHDGRIGDHEELPMLIFEATDESLDAFIKAQGGYDLPDRVTPSVFPTADGSVVYPTPTPVVHPTATPQPHWMVTRPMNLVATWDGEAVTLTWDAPDIDVEIVGYAISRGVGLQNGKPRANSFVWDTGSSETSFVDDGSLLPLYSGKTHYYKVKALTVLGPGFRSEAAGVTVP